MFFITKKNTLNNLQQAQKWKELNNLENWGWFIDIDKNFSSIPKKNTNKYRPIKPNIYDLPVIQEEEENSENIYKLCGNYNIFQIISTSFITCIIIYIPITCIIKFI
jgi:hypothetical protein